MTGAESLWIVALHLALTGLPGVAAALALARRGVASVPILLVAGLAASGIVGLLAFWLYYAGPTIGQTFSFFAAFGSALATGWLLWERRIDGTLLKRLAVPLGLWILGTYFLFFLGYLHGGQAEALGTTSTRFSGQLPTDNDIPFFFAEWFYRHGHALAVPEFPGGWLSSDRPPLQIGYVLAQRPFYGSHLELHYEAIGVAIQQLWIVGLWALLVAARLGRVTKALVMITVLTSDVAIVNGFYVWPKLLPAAMLLGAAALVLTPLWTGVRRSFWGAALFAALLGLAMMGHGGSVFAVIPLVVVAAWRGLPSWRWIGAAALVGILFVAPWSAYQKWGDPPGNRLTKWMLAGSMEIDSRGLRQTILDSYGEVGVGGALHDKGQNFVQMAGGGPAVDTLRATVTAASHGHVAEALTGLRSVWFFDLLPSLGLLLIVPILMALARARGRQRAADWSFALTSLAVVAIGAAAWGLLMFGNIPARTVLQAGTFALPILAFCACVAGLRATFPRFAIWFTLLSAALMLAVYVPALTPPPGTSYSPLAILVAALGLAGFGGLSLRAGAGERGREPETAAKRPGRAGLLTGG
jgi:hypothetical protein